MKKTLMLLTLTIGLNGCSSFMLTDNTLEQYTLAQLKGAHANAVKYPWWFDNKKAADIYAAEIKRRGAINYLAEQEASKH